MRQTLIIPLLLTGLLSCRNAGVEPGEVAATVTNDLIIDNWSKGCSGGGLEIKIDNDFFTASNSLPAAYGDARILPVAVWIRYEPAEPDTCTHSTNRIRILSIRNR